MNNKAPAKAPLLQSIDAQVGRAVRSFRISKGTTIRDLAEVTGVSTAMISRIENGNVSPSLATLEALATGLKVPTINLFQFTTHVTDVMYVKSGDGLPATRFTKNHQHDYQVLGKHNDEILSFEQTLITLTQNNPDELPVYQGHGFIFIYALKGQAVYSCANKEFKLSAGDSLSFGANSQYGFSSIITPSFTYISAYAHPAK
jgi:transcriptional regulator with XRE-family HTH domain